MNKANAAFTELYMQKVTRVASKAPLKKKKKQMNLRRNATLATGSNLKAKR